MYLQPRENEDILNWILTTFDASSVEIRHIIYSHHPVPSLHEYFYPHKTSGEGLFMESFKNDGTPFTIKRKRATVSKSGRYLLLPNMTKYTPYRGETLGILPNNTPNSIHTFLQSRAIIKDVKSRMAKGMKPAHSLALYHKLQQKHVTHQEVDLTTPPIPTQRRHPFRGSRE